MDLCKGRLAIIQREKTFDNRQIRKKIVPEKKKTLLTQGTVFHQYRYTVGGLECGWDVIQNTFC